MIEDPNCSTGSLRKRSPKLPSVRPHLVFFVTLACVLVAACVTISALVFVGHANKPRASSTVQTELAATALQLAQQNGDGSPGPIEAVQTTATEGIQAIGSGDTAGDGSADAYVIELQGSFNGSGSKAPAGVTPTVAGYLDIVVDSTDYQVLGWSLTAQAIDLSTLGSPFPLPAGN